VKRVLSTELEFDKVKKLVAAQARTCLGHRFLTEAGDLPSFTSALRAAEVTLAVDHLIADGGTLSLSGLDEASQWLQPDAPVPTDPHDLLALLTLARRIAGVRKRLLSGPAELADIIGALPDTTGLVSRVAPRLGRDGTIPDQASPELARLRRQMARARQDLLQQLEGIRRSHPKAATDAPPTLRRDRYCLPVRAGFRAEVPGLMLDTSGSGATAFVEPLQVVELNNELATASAKERDEVRRIVAEIAGAFLEIRDELAVAVDALAELDAAQAKVKFGQLIQGRVITPGEDEEFVLCRARHPLLDERLHPLRLELFGDVEQRGPSLRAVPLDFRLPEGVRTLVVSGPNAGGKTVVLKTLGLMALMCFHGIPLPVDEATTIPRFDHIWCHIGDEQDVSADLSSFSGAMVVTAGLLAEADERSLVLYDELGAGTDPLEGAALGCALLEELASRSCLSVATTHLAAIAMSAGETAGMDNAAMEYDEDKGRATYTLSMGRPGRSRALEIADRSGIPVTVLDRARDLLGGQHLELDRWLTRLEHLEQELLDERSAVAHQQRQLRDQQQELDTRLRMLEHERENMSRELGEERDRLRRRAQKRLDQAIDRLDEAMARQESIGKRQRQRLRDAALAFDKRPLKADEAATANVKPGTRVHLTSLKRLGILEEIRGGQALVTVGDKRLWVPSSDVAASDSATTPHRATVQISSEESAESELKLLGMDGEQARDEIEKFLDRALTTGRTSVRVVHGHGTGTLRRIVAEVCREHPAVRSFRHPSQRFGGTGVTEVTLDVGD
jgi:DNA mismatch repair protein MutS2